jgi:hypothetical protein
MFPSKRNWISYKKQLAFVWEAVILLKQLIYIPFLLHIDLYKSRLGIREKLDFQFIYNKIIDILFSNAWHSDVENLIFC